MKRQSPLYYERKRMEIIYRYKKRLQLEDYQDKSFIIAQIKQHEFKIQSWYAY